MSPVTPNRAALAGALDIARRDLLDLGLRNTLLNYRPLVGKGLEVIDEKPREIFRLLVEEGKSLTFLPGKEGESTDTPLAQPEEDGAVAARHTDSRLQTAYTSAQLQGRLLATYHAARTSMEEQGVNTLYLALGMLSWRDEDAVDKFCRAPLILIPVELERSDARDRFHMKYTGEELGGNVSLAEKLKQNFGIKSFPDLPDADDLDVEGYFNAVGIACRSQSGWRVDTNAIALGFFSFAKFLMYRDLDPATWPAADAILDHDILHSLLTESGFEQAASNYNPEQLLDDQLDGREAFHVVDSDSSQTLAILDALDRHSMVIQGPPGTGKSQTIVNLIAAAVAEGKRVLFVSEKMAALDVVKRRLDHVRLGAACLELHSNRTNKKSIIEELRRTAFGERPGNPRPGAELSLLPATRQRLNDYCQAVNEPIGESGESPCTAYGKLLEAQSALQNSETPQLAFENTASWTAEEIVRRTHLVAQLQDCVSRTGVPAEHPFWGTRLNVLLPLDRDAIRTACITARSACDAYQRSAALLAGSFSVEAPTAEPSVHLLQQSVQQILEAPDLTGVKLSSREWMSREPEIQQVIATGQRYRELHRQFGEILNPSAWTTNVAAIRSAIADVGGKWWRFVSGRWRTARKTLESLSAGPPPASQQAQLAVLDAIIEAAACLDRLNQASEMMSPLFGSSWKIADSNWELLDSQTTWMVAARRGIRQESLAEWCLDAARIEVDRNLAKAQLQQLTAAQETYQAAVTTWSQRLAIDDARLAGKPFDELTARWTQQSDRIDDLHALVAFNQISAECSKHDLAAVADAATLWPLAGTLLSALYERARLSALLHRAFQERESLAGFDGIRHASTVAEFNRLDLLQIEYNRARLAAQHAQSLPSGGGAGEIGVLWHEFEKRARFLPIRTLMSKAGHAIQSIKPVFMMSPLSIANFIPPGALAFDLVIFDEASQVRPVDALGAIVRGQQVVVVGDSRQLPPTSFFDAMVSSENEDAEPDDQTAATSDIESVLGLFCSRGAHQRMLRWHYRSRHESLIAVSNHLFYDDRLVVFPSPDRGREKLGLLYRRVENAPYDRGRTRTNPVEAKAVAEAAMAHARSQLQLPRERRETLGVAAFSMAQKDAILNELELLRRQDPSCEEFFAYPPHEPFFVKNLETVQGDERDVILISIGYGRTAEGYLSMSFGPLNRAGGERRLNVLITRARRRCEVFTTLAADDIDISKTDSSGIAALKTFLNYAQNGHMDIPAPTGKSFDSEFEEQVQRQLSAVGIDAHAQVGSAGFFLDLAVVDASNPGRYVLGIECDGARYHSARSTRDRDRLRQTVLEGLGWHIHRIWSTSWFQNPDQELRKVVQAIETARALRPSAPVPLVPAPEPPPALPPTPVQLRTAVPPAAPYRSAELNVQLGNVEIHLVNRSQLANLLAEVVNVESPVHWTEASRRVINAVGIQRFGARIQQAFEEAVRTGVSTKLFRKQGDFLWNMEMDQPEVRHRGDLSSSGRKIELVAPEEVRCAILAVVKQSVGIAPEDVPAAVCRLFGFTRASDEMIGAIASHRDVLMQQGRLALQGGNLIFISIKAGA